MKYQRLLVSALFVCTLVFGSHTAWAATAVSACTRLTHSGPYVLTQNIKATTAAMTSTWNPSFIGCIVIAANFVTLDMAGHVITGPGGTCSAIPCTTAIAQDATGRHGDIVRSGSVTNFWFGVTFAGGGHTIQGVNSSNNGLAGISIQDAGNRVIGNTANNNQIGIEVITCPNLLLENMATGNVPQDIVEGCTDVRQENSPAP